MKPGRRARAPVLLCAVCLLAVSLTGCGKSAEKKAVADPAAEESPQKPAKVEAFGTIIATRNRAIGLDFPAAVADVRVIQGQLVKRGDLLAELDLSVFRSQVEAARQAVTIGELKLRQLERDYEQEGAAAARDYRTLTNSIDAAEAEIDELAADLGRRDRLYQSRKDPEIRRRENELSAAKDELAKASEELDRRKMLSDAGAVPQQEASDAVAAVESKSATVRTLQLALESFLADRGRELSERRLELAQKRAELANLEIKLAGITNPAVTAIETQRETLKGLQVQRDTLASRLERSFLDGDRVVCDLDEAVVSEVSCAKGDVFIESGKVLTLTDLSSLIAIANVPEEFIKDVRTDAPVTIKPVADPKRRYRGTVVSVSSMAKDNNGETVVPVRIALTDNDGFLKPNFNIDVVIGESEEEAAASNADAKGVPSKP